MRYEGRFGAVATTFGRNLTNWRGIPPKTSGQKETRLGKWSFPSLMAIVHGF
jgi:hypothetical protein